MIFFFGTWNANFPSDINYIPALRFERKNIVERT